MCFVYINFKGELVPRVAIYNMPLTHYIATLACTQSQQLFSYYELSEIDGNPIASYNTTAVVICMHVTCNINI